MMATYFHGGSEIQSGSDNLQTLYLMNPNYVTAYTSDAPNNNPPNMAAAVLLNPSGSGLGSPGSGGLPGGHHHHQQLIGIPLAGGSHSETHRPMVPGGGGGSQLHGVAVSRVHYNLWSPTADPNQGTVAVPGLDGDGSGPIGFRRPNTGGLSLSLSPHHQQNTNNDNNNNNSGNNPMGGRSSVSNGGGVQGGMVGSKYLKATQELLDEVVNVGSYCSGENGETSSGAHKEKGKLGSSAANKETVSGDHQGGKSGGGGSGKKVAEQLSTAQKQELQMKKAKLLNMLDEVEQRYRQYHTQMQVVVSSFEQAAGLGSAKSYTSLALKTISKQFRCLKDAIVSQIKATSKSLGEDQDSNGAGGSSKLEGGGVGSRLRFVDHQLRQQRALQQLGMMQHNAWRPQRGLPERAVSVLRAWLFEHFLHPYPRDSDKHMLAKQTGLTRSQVSNWFINARVRLWKPMVEEMYLEEVKSQEQNGGNSENNTNANTNNSGASTGNDPNKDQSTSKAIVAPQQQQKHDQQHNVGGGLMQARQQGGDHHVTNDMISNLSAMSTTSMSSQGFTLIGSSSDMESLMVRSPKKQRSMQSSPSSILSMDMEMKPPDHHQNKYAQQDHRQSHTPMIIAANHDHHQQHHQGLNNPYIVNNDMMERFHPDNLLTAHQYHGNNNGVSLTLSLPHCENHQSLSLSGNPHQQNFIPNQGMQLGRRLDMGGGEDQGELCGISMGMGQPSHPSNGYESIDIQNRKRFAAHQLLHDFVA